MLSCALMVLPIVLAPRVASPWLATGLISLAMAGHCGWAANIFTIVSDIFPRRAVSSVTGICGFGGAAGGMLVSSAVGFVLQATRSYLTIFALASFSYLVGLGIIHLMSPRLETVNLEVPNHVTKTTSRERVLCTLDHRQPDRIPLDFGGTFVSGIHVSCVLALREYFGLEQKPVKVIDPGQFLGEIEEDLKLALGIDTEGIIRRMTRFGFPAEDWKPYRMYDGAEVLVPGGFNVTIDEHGDTLMHPLGDLRNPPSARMPNGGYFFDAIIRQQPIDEDHLDPADNLEEFGPISEEELAHLEREARRASATGRAVVANFGGTSFGDIALVPGLALPHPKGIRDITEWYMSTRARRDYVHAVFAGQCQIALANLERIAARLGEPGGRGERLRDGFRHADFVVLLGGDFPRVVAALLPRGQQLGPPQHARGRRSSIPAAPWKNLSRHSSRPASTFSTPCSAPPPAWTPKPSSRNMAAIWSSGAAAWTPSRCCPFGTPGRSARAGAASVRSLLPGRRLCV